MKNSVFFRRLISGPSFSRPFTKSKSFQRSNIAPVSVGANRQVTPQHQTFTRSFSSSSTPEAEPSGADIVDTKAEDNVDDVFTTESNISKDDKGQKNVNGAASSRQRKPLTKQEIIIDQILACNPQAEIDHDFLLECLIRFEIDGSDRFANFCKNALGRLKTKTLTPNECLVVLDFLVRLGSSCSKKQSYKIDAQVRLHTISAQPRLMKQIVAVLERSLFGMSGDRIDERCANIYNAEKIHSNYAEDGCPLVREVVESLPLTHLNKLFFADRFAENSIARVQARLQQNDGMNSGMRGARRNVANDENKSDFENDVDDENSEMTNNRVFRDKVEDGMRDMDPVDMEQWEKERYFVILQNFIKLVRLIRVHQHFQYSRLFCYKKDK